MGGAVIVGGQVDVAGGEVRGGEAGEEGEEVGLEAGKRKDRSVSCGVRGWGGGDVSSARGWTARLGRITRLCWLTSQGHDSRSV